MIESFLPLASKALGVVERVKDITTKKFSAVVGGLALRCGWLLVFANAALIIIKHRFQCCAANGFGSVSFAKRLSNPQQLLNN